MATFANAQAIYSLTATATPAGSDVTGTLTVGKAATVLSMTGADTALSCKATAATTANSFTFYPATGVATVLAGTPVLADADGIDAEGATIAAMTKAYGVLLKAGPANSGPITVHTADSFIGTTFSLGVGEVRPISSTTYLLLDMTKTWTVTLPVAADFVEITIVGV